MNHKNNNNSIDLLFLVFLFIINVLCLIPLGFFFFSLAIGVTTESVSISMTELTDVLIKLLLFIFAIVLLNRFLLFIYKLTTKQYMCSNPFKKRKTIGEKMNGTLASNNSVVKHGLKNVRVVKDDKAI